MKVFNMKALPLVSALSLGTAFGLVTQAQAASYGYDPECPSGLVGREGQDLANHMAQNPPSEWSRSVLVGLRTLDFCQRVEVEAKAGRIVDNQAAEAVSALSYVEAAAGRRRSGAYGEYIDRVVKDPELYNIMEGYGAYLQGNNSSLTKDQAMREIRQWAANRKADIRGSIEGGSSGCDRSPAPRW